MQRRVSGWSRSPHGRCCPAAQPLCCHGVETSPSTQVLEGVTRTPSVTWWVWEQRVTGRLEYKLQERQSQVWTLPPLFISSVSKGTPHPGRARILACETA